MRINIYSELVARNMKFHFPRKSQTWQRYGVNSCYAQDCLISGLL